VRKRKQKKVRNERNVIYGKGIGPHGGYMMTVTVMNHSAHETREATIEMTPGITHEEAWTHLTDSLRPWFILYCQRRDIATRGVQLWATAFLNDLRRNRFMADQVLHRDAPKVYIPDLSKDTMFGTTVTLHGVDEVAKMTPRQRNWILRLGQKIGLTKP